MRLDPALPAVLNPLAALVDLVVLPHLAVSPWLPAELEDMDTTVVVLSQLAHQTSETARRNSPVLLKLPARAVTKAAKAARVERVEREVLLEVASVVHQRPVPLELRPLEVLRLPVIKDVNKAVLPLHQAERCSNQLALPVAPSQLELVHPVLLNHLVDSEVTTVATTVATDTAAKVVLPQLAQNSVTLELSHLVLSPKVVLDQLVDSVVNKAALLHLEDSVANKVVPLHLEDSVEAKVVSHLASHPELLHQDSKVLPHLALHPALLPLLNLHLK